MREREKDTLVIDICPNCRGVFLDAGELEKLTEVEHRYYRDYNWDDDDDDDDDYRRRGQDPRYGGDPRYADRRYEGDQQGYPPRKKRGFLGGLMESFGGDD